MPDELELSEAAKDEIAKAARQNATILHAIGKTANSYVQCGDGRVVKVSCQFVKEPPS